MSSPDTAGNGGLYTPLEDAFGSTPSFQHPSAPHTIATSAKGGGGNRRARMMSPPPQHSVTTASAMPLHSTTLVEAMHQRQHQGFGQRTSPDSGDNPSATLSLAKSSEPLSSAPSVPFGGGGSRRANAPAGLGRLSQRLAGMPPLNTEAPQRIRVGVTPPSGGASHPSWGGGSALHHNHNNNSINTNNEHSDALFGGSAYSRSAVAFGQSHPRGAGTASPLMLSSSMLGGTPPHHQQFSIGSHSSPSGGATTAATKGRGGGGGGSSLSGTNRRWFVLIVLLALNLIVMLGFASTRLFAAEEATTTRTSIGLSVGPNGKVVIVPAAFQRRGLVEDSNDNNDGGVVVGSGGEKDGAYLAEARRRLERLHAVANNGQQQNGAAIVAGEEGAIDKASPIRNGDPIAELARLQWEQRRDQNKKLLEQRLLIARGRQQNDNGDQNGGGGGAVREAVADAVAAHAELGDRIGARMRIPIHNNQQQQQQLGKPPVVDPDIVAQLLGGGGGATQPSNKKQTPPSSPQNNRVTPASLSGHGQGYIKVAGLTDPIVVAALIYEEMVRAHEFRAMEEEEEACFNYAHVDESFAPSAASAADMKLMTTPTPGQPVPQFTFVPSSRFPPRSRAVLAFPLSDIEGIIEGDDANSEKNDKSADSDSEPTSEEGDSASVMTIGSEDAAGPMLRLPKPPAAEQRLVIDVVYSFVNPATPSFRKAMRTRKRRELRRKLREAEAMRKKLDHEKGKAAANQQQQNKANAGAGAAAATARLLPEHWWSNENTNYMLIRQRLGSRFEMRNLWTAVHERFPSLLKGTAAAESEYVKGFTNRCAAEKRIAANSEIFGPSDVVGAFNGNLTVCGVDELLERLLHESLADVEEAHTRAVEDAESWLARALTHLNKTIVDAEEAAKATATTSLTTAVAAAPVAVESNNDGKSSRSRPTAVPHPDDEEDDSEDKGIGSGGVADANGGVDGSVSDQQRYRDWDEILYSLRGNYYNLMGGPRYGGGLGKGIGPDAASAARPSTVRNIYIVVSDRDQAPPWLRSRGTAPSGSTPLERDFADRIVLVEHRELVPSHLQPTALPTFNSYAIEALLHRIPGIARHYIYFNNDMLLARPVSFFDYFQPYVVYPSAEAANGQHDGRKAAEVRWLPYVMIDRMAVVRCTLRLGCPVEKDAVLTHTAKLLEEAFAWERAPVLRTSSVMGVPFFFYSHYPHLIDRDVMGRLLEGRGYDMRPRGSEVAWADLSPNPANAEDFLAAKVRAMFTDPTGTGNGFRSGGDVFATLLYTHYLLLFRHGGDSAKARAVLHNPKYNGPIVDSLVGAGGSSVPAGGPPTAYSLSIERNNGAKKGSQEALRVPAGGVSGAEKLDDPFGTETAFTDLGGRVRKPLLSHIALVAREARSEATKAQTKAKGGSSAGSEIARWQVNLPASPHSSRPASQLTISASSSLGDNASWASVAQIILANELLNIFRHISNPKKEGLPARFFSRSPAATTPLSAAFAGRPTEEEEQQEGEEGRPGPMVSPRRSPLPVVAVSHMSTNFLRNERKKADMGKCPSALRAPKFGDNSSAASPTQAALMMTSAPLYLDYRCRAGAGILTVEGDRRALQGVTITSSHDGPPPFSLAAEVACEAAPSFPLLSINGHKSANRRGSYDHWLQDFANVIAGTLSHHTSAGRCYFGMMGLGYRQVATKIPLRRVGTIAPRTSTYEDLVPRRGKVLFLTINDDMDSPPPSPAATTRRALQQRTYYSEEYVAEEVAVKGTRRELLGAEDDSTADSFSEELPTTTNTTPPFKPLPSDGSESDRFALLNPRVLTAEVGPFASLASGTVGVASNGLQRQLSTNALLYAALGGTEVGSTELLQLKRHITAAHVGVTTAGPSDAALIVLLGGHSAKARKGLAEGPGGSSTPAGASEIATALSEAVEATRLRGALYGNFSRFVRLAIGTSQTALRSVDSNDGDDAEGDGGGKAQGRSDRKGFGSAWLRLLAYMTNDVTRAYPSLNSEVAKKRAVARVRMLCAIAYAEHAVAQMAHGGQEVARHMQAIVSPPSSSSTAVSRPLLSPSIVVPAETKEPMPTPPPSLNFVGAPAGAEELVLIYQAFAPPWPAPWEREWRWRNASDIHPLGIG